MDMEISDEEIEKLIKGYNQSFQLVKSIGHGITAFYSMVDHLKKEEDLQDIRDILGFIADQFSDKSTEVKEQNFEAVGEKIKRLTSSEEIKYIEYFFRSLSELPPDTLEGFKLHQVK
jgi:hypothetical protein